MGLRDILPRSQKSSAEHDSPENNDIWSHRLLIAWRAGQRIADKNPDMAEGARLGEIPVTPYEGEYRKLKEQITERYVPIFYYAEWLGLRGDALEIDPGCEYQVTCTRTGSTTTFTSDIERHRSL